MVSQFHKAENIPLVILSILVVASNTVICVLVIARKSMRTYTNGFVCSLAVSDILIGGVLLPANLAGIDHVIQGYIVSVVLLAGVANVATVTLDRYIAVLKPFYYQSILRKYYLKILATSWSLVMGVSLLPLTWSTNSSITIYKIYVLCEQIVFVVLPYCFVFIAYYRIFRLVRITVKRDNTLKASLNLNTPCEKNRPPRASRSSDRKVARLSIVIALSFLLTWLPVEYLTLMSYIGQWALIPEQLPIISRYTIVLGALVDPLVYAFLKPDFRKAFRDILARRRRRERVGSRARAGTLLTTLGSRRRQSESTTG